MTKIEALLELVRQLPEGLRSDWRGTNHFELTQPNPDAGSYWWLGAEDIREEYPGEFTDRAQAGQRLGLLMDIAEAAKAAEGELEIAARPVKVYTRPEFSIDPGGYEDEGGES